jgi:chaperonin GroEL (HSP60 family)
MKTWIQSLFFFQILSTCTATRRLAAFGRKQTGLDQYAIEKFSRALEVVPRTLAENAGLNATDVVYNLYAAHAAGLYKLSSPQFYLSHESA